MTAEINGDDVKINGHACNIGVSHGINEIKNPRRTVTTSVRVDTGEAYFMLPVKTLPDIPKDKIFDCVAEVKKLNITRSVAIGDVLIENVLNTGSNVVATRNVKLGE
jgi:CxxC motif-containing protein